MQVTVQRPCYDVTTQRTLDIDPMLFCCWPIVYDAGPTSKQHRISARPCSRVMMNSHLVNDVIASMLGQRLRRWPALSLHRTNISRV